MSQHAPGFLKVVDLAKQQIQEITIDEVTSKKNSGETFYFVDVREDSEWNGGYASGAIHIGKGVIERDIESKIPDKNALIVLYCGGGYRSALAAQSLSQMGYTNVQSMIGGWRSWKEAGLPTEKI